MGITIVGNPFVWFRRYYDADTIVSPIVVKSRNMGIMVCEANGYYLSILGFKSCIFTSTAKTLCTNSFRYIGTLLNLTDKTVSLFCCQRLSNLMLQLSRDFISCINYISSIIV